MPAAGQIAFGGPEVRLEPATAQTLALALHELVTNSAKYGALSALSGRLSVRLGARRRHAATGVGGKRRSRGAKAGVARVSAPEA